VGSAPSMSMVLPLQVKSVSVPVSVVSVDADSAMDLGPRELGNLM
jgi:hypothetical protein